MTDDERRQLDRIEKMCSRTERALFGAEGDPKDDGIQGEVERLNRAMFGDDDTERDEQGVPLGVANKVNIMYRGLEPVFKAKKGLMYLILLAVGAAITAAVGAVRDFLAGGPTP